MPPNQDPAKLIEASFERINQKLDHSALHHYRGLQKETRISLLLGVVYVYMSYLGKLGSLFSNK